MDSNNIILTFLVIIFFMIFIPFLFFFSGLSALCSVASGYEPPCHTCVVGFSAELEAEFGGIIAYLQAQIAALNTLFLKWEGEISGDVNNWVGDATKLFNNWNNDINKWDQDVESWSTLFGGDLNAWEAKTVSWEKSIDSWGSGW
jgi:hypothetical protein